MVDFEKGRDLRVEIMEKTGGPAAGGLTVRDVIATTAMGAYIEKFGSRSFTAIAQSAYAMADAMLHERLRQFDPNRAVLMDSIETLELTVRAENCLRAENIETIGQLVSFSSYELLKLPNLGKTTLEEIVKQLSLKGLKLDKYNLTVEEAFGLNK